MSYKTEKPAMSIIILPMKSIKTHLPTTALVLTRSQEYSRNMSLPVQRGKPVNCLLNPRGSLAKLLTSPENELLVMIWPGFLNFLTWSGIKLATWGGKCHVNDVAGEEMKTKNNYWPGRKKWIIIDLDGLSSYDLAGFFTIAAVPFLSLCNR